MSEYPELDRLVDGVRHRSDAAFSELHALTGDALATFAFSMLRDRRAAEDAVQQAFLELVRAADTFKGDGRSLRAWLFKSVRFTCLDEIRRRSRHPETPVDVLPEQVAGDGTIDVPGLDPDLERCMEQLSQRQRMLIALRHVVGLSGAETAAVMGMSRPAAYAATSRAEKKLRSLLLAVESSESAASLHRRAEGTP